MARLLFTLLAIASLNAQLLVDTYAGGAIPAGVPAQNVALGPIAGITWDPSGNVIFCDVNNNVIRRVRTDGTMETIAGTGVTGFGGDGARDRSRRGSNPHRSRRKRARRRLAFDDFLIKGVWMASLKSRAFRPVSD